MAHKRKHLLAAAARAREARLNQQQSANPGFEEINSENTAPKSNLALEINSDEECCWEGGVNHTLSSDSEFYQTEGESEESTSDSEEFSEVEDEDLLRSLQENLAQELKMLASPTPYQEVLQNLTTKDWKKAEQNRGFGYTGNSQRSKERDAQKARAKAVQDEALRKT